MKISVIVPVYNSITCLERCVESIRNQTYKDIEIILVDDGSTDGSGELIDNYAAADSRIRAFHKPNGGASSARNLGIREAGGDYVGFVDSDDYIDLVTYELLAEAALRTGHDIVQISRDEVSETGDRLPDVCIPPKDERFCRTEDFIKELLLHEADCSFCTKLIKKDLFDGVGFPEGELNEDFKLLIEMLGKVEGVYILPRQGYHVVCRTSSTTRSRTEDSFSRVFTDIVYNADMMQKYVDDKYPSLHKYAVRFNLFQRLDYLLHVPISQMKHDNTFYVSVIKYLRANFGKMLVNPYLTGKNKLYLTFLTVAPAFTRKVHAFKRGIMA